MPNVSEIWAPLERTAARGDVPGIPLPPYSAHEFKRRLPEGYQQGDFGELKIWEKLELHPSSTRKAWQAEQIELNNQIRRRVRWLQAWSCLLNRIAHGIYDGGDLQVGGLNDTSNFFRYPIVSATSTSVTLRYVEGDTVDPRNIEVQELAYEEGSGDVEVNTIGTHALMPQLGVLTWSGNMRYRHHGGAIIRSISVPANLSDQDTFTVHLLTPIDAEAATERFPSDNEDVKECLIHVYATYPETWNEPRDDLPMWCVKTVQVIDHPVAEDTLVVAGRTVCPTVFAGAWKFEVSEDDGESYSEVDLTAYVRVEHSSGGDYRTYLDLTSVAGHTVGDWDKLRLTYWLETPEAQDAVFFQATCLHDHIDHSGSWGQDDGNGVKRYCNKAGETGVLDHNFIPGGCYQCNHCPFFEPYVSTHPMDQATLAQLFYAFPWEVRQAQPGIPDYSISRKEVPSLAANAGIDMALPTGFHPIIKHLIGAGGWYGRVIESTGQDAVLTFLDGFEWRPRESAFAMPDLRSAGSWPALGPAGGNFAKPAYGGGAHDDESDPHQIERSALGVSGMQIDMYQGTRSGELGRQVRVGHISDYQWFFWDLEAGTDEQDRHGNKFQRGSWSFMGKNYDWRIVINKGIQDIRTRDDAMPDTPQASATVQSFERSLGYGRVFFENGTLSASSPTSTQLEFQTSWRAGGTHVDLPEWARVRNWACSQSYRGMAATGKFRVGMVVTSPQWTGDLAGKYFWVTKVQACAMDRKKQDWNPASNDVGVSYLHGGYIFIPYVNDPSERLQSIVITRDSGGVTLDSVVASPFRRYDMAKDQFCYLEETNEAGVFGLKIFFSPLQLTGVSIDEQIAITISTKEDDGTTHNYSTVNADLANDVAAASYRSFSDPNGQNITGITSVIAHRRDGQQVTLSAEAEPDNIADFVGRDRYSVISTGATATILVNPEYAGDPIEVQATVAALSANYYSDYIAIHGAQQLAGPGVVSGALPAHYQTWGNRQDMIEFHDEHGLLAQETNQLAAAGYTLQAYWRGRMLPQSAGGFKVESWDGETLTDITENCVLLGASGIIYGSGGDAEGNTLVISGKMADNRRAPLADEIDAWPKILRRLLG